MLNEFRNKIDKIDREIVMLLSERSEISKKIGVLKAKNCLDVLNSDREEELVLRLEEIGLKKGLDNRYIKDIFGVILKESRKVQDE